MLDRVRAGVRTLSVISLLAIFSAQAQTAQPVISSSSDAGATSLASRRPNRQTPSQVDTAELIARANKSVGTDVHKSISDWQQELSRVESDLKQPSLHYSELNDFRDQLQRLRGETHNFRTHLEPTLAAAKGDLGLLGPTPAAGSHQSRTILLEAGRIETITWGCCLPLRLQSIPSTCASITCSILFKIFAERTSRRACCSRSPVPFRIKPGLNCRIMSQLPRIEYYDIMTGWWESLSNGGDISIVVFEFIVLLTWPFPHGRVRHPTPAASFIGG